MGEVVNAPQGGGMIWIRFDNMGGQSATSKPPPPLNASISPKFKFHSDLSSCSVFRFRAFQFHIHKIDWAILRIGLPRKKTKWKQWLSWPCTSWEPLTIINQAGVFGMFFVWMLSAHRVSYSCSCWCWKPLLTNLYPHRLTINLSAASTNQPTI